jgi:Trk K+ transport system NAD-binding subunit
VNEVGFRNRRLEGTPLQKIRLPGNALILSIRRDGTIMVPQAEMVLKEGDRIGLIGSPESLELAIAMLRG